MSGTHRALEGRMAATLAALVTFAAGHSARAQTPGGSSASSAVPAAGTAACTLESPGLVARPDSGFSHVGVAASGDEALVTWALDPVTRYVADQEGESVTHLFERRLHVQTARWSRPAEIGLGRSECTSTGDAVAVRWGNRVTHFTFAAAAGDEWNRDLAFGYGSPGSVRARATVEPSAIAAAGDGTQTIAVAIATEYRCSDPCACQDAPTGIAVRAYVPVRSRIETYALYTVRFANGPRSAPAPSLYAPAVALRSAGGGAVAWLENHTLRFLRLDATLHASGDPVTIASGDVGSPAIAFRGDDAVIVYASRESASATYQLRAVVWNSAQPAPPPPVALTTGTTHAIAPAVSARADRIVVAWTEGDLSRVGAIRLGSSAGSISDAAAHASIVSDTTMNARDPELAMTADRTWLVYQQFGSQGRHTVREIRSALVQCR